MPLQQATIGPLEGCTIEEARALRARLIAAEAHRVELSKKALAMYWSDPVAFVHDCFTWDDSKPAEYQEEIWAAVPTYGKVAVRSLHGVGKTTTNALAMLWFAITRDAAHVDWKLPSTAGAWRQLDQYLWPEIRKWVRKIDWATLGRQPFNQHEMLKLNLNLTYGSSFAVASDVPALIEGVHADSVLYIFDESKSIRAETFDAAEGAFSGTGEAFAIASSTPGEPAGRFYDICTKKPGLEDWHSIHIDLERAVAAGRVDRPWADRRAMQWGINSALYANRVLGEFHADDESGVIPLSWVEQAVARWEATSKNLALDPDPNGERNIEVLGVDVARGGDDKTALALRWDNRIHELRYSHHEDTMETAGKAGGVLSANPGCRCVVDTDGLGAGVTDRLREQGFEVESFHAGSNQGIKYQKDSSGELGFVNIRSAAWWNLRQLLDPTSRADLELPPDEDLIGDLTSPQWKVNSKSQIVVEPKIEIKKRIHRSTDGGDSVVQAFWKKKPRKRAGMSHAGR